MDEPATLNVRCCCTPGLVLGRLPKWGGEFGRFVVSGGWGEIVDLQIQTASGSRKRPGPDGPIVEVWTEEAYNSNHGTVETLSRLAGFELVCNIPNKRRFWPD